MKPGTCETNSSLLNAAKAELLRLEGSGLMIVVAHLGTGERSSTLNRRRLFNVSRYLSQYIGLEPERIIVAEGKRLSSFGRIEIYVGGRLVETLFPPRGRDICVSCCGDDNNFFSKRVNRPSAYP
jgi:hypothetical protein